MDDISPLHRKAQLDKEEREHLEDVVTEMRDRVEANVRYQLEDVHDLAERPDGDALDDEVADLVEAIDLEAADDDADWEEGFEQYLTGVGYTIVNRLAGLRCMEVRGFIDTQVTVFREDGITPAAARIAEEEFLLQEEALLEAYTRECDALADEIEILFDRSTRYSVLDPDADTFEDLCGMLDEVPDEVWRADDVLGWVYEYYNRPVVEALDAKNALEPEDVGPANQFYTPHWVVRMLTDNSLGKLYLEATDQESTIPDPEALAPDERKERAVTPEDSPTVPELCTYLIPDEEPGDAPDFEHPSELRVIDPACGSGHFLLYAFDVLERIWWAETDLDRAEIPAKVLEHNLYGVDIDLRSCQLSAFNLYLKARTRAEAEDGEFEMPNVDVVCADASVAEVEEGAAVLDDITGEGTELREALDDIIDTFQHTEALGSLLDVSGTLEGVFESGQTGLSDWGDGTHQSLNSFLKALREAVAERSAGSFGEQNLKSFLNLLVVLTQEYDVALMNPPYGSRGRMPKDVKKYIKENYRYSPEYYINFFEKCDDLTKEHGRIGELVPWTFIFNKAFEDFRKDFVGKSGQFDFLAEFGYDVLDNAMVGTVGTVVKTGSSGTGEGTFIRLHDVEKEDKEEMFLQAGFENDVIDGVQRFYRRDTSTFNKIPGAPLSYWVPDELRSLYDSETVFDADNAGTADKRSLGDIKIGLQTGDDDRFLRQFWEINKGEWVPFAKGGVDAWILPRIKLSINWASNGAELKRYAGSYPRNEQFYFNEAITYNRTKRSGRRFGFLHSESIFSDAGPILATDSSPWHLLSYANSRLVTYLMLAQTPERKWEGSYVSKLPWYPEVEQRPELADSAKSIIGALLTKRQYDFISPHYDGPVLLDILGVRDPLPMYKHPHRELKENLDLVEPDETVHSAETLTDIGVEAARHLQRVEQNLQSCADRIDDAVFNCFDITDEQRETVLQEIALRTIEDPRKQEDYDPEAITEPSEEFPEQVKDLLLHFTLQVVNDADDGIVPISRVDGEDDLLTRIEGEFERVWGEHATDRLAEVDDVLGARSAEDEAYPNLRAWLEEDLFEYHVAKFDRTPILWRFTSERLVSDPEGEGFGCLVDYHQLDAGVFDRLQNNYLDPRRTHLRERRVAADGRRGDQSLPASEQAEAAEVYERCVSGLEQLDVFEERLRSLVEADPREWPTENQERAAAAAESVAEFRDRTASRLETLDALAERDDVDMEELFSPSFYETVQKNREEWIDALEDLEAAFEAYAAEGTEPVEAHLYDLFEYYEDLVGSDHYASNGILFMTYYFEQFEDAGQAQIGSGGVSERERLLSELATDVESFKTLAEAIAEDCDAVAADIPNDWETRALSEVTTAGYQPVHKHGVAINLTPLADTEIVPELVDKKVL